MPAAAVPEFTPERWSKWVKDKEYAENRVEQLEEELDNALEGQCSGRSVDGMGQEGKLPLSLRVVAVMTRASKRYNSSGTTIVANKKCRRETKRTCE